VRQNRITGGPHGHNTYNSRANIVSGASEKMQKKHVEKT
jgi:hypothetical protein